VALDAAVLELYAGAAGKPAGHSGEVGPPLGLQVHAAALLRKQKHARYALDIEAEPKRRTAL